MRNFRGVNYEFFPTRRMNLKFSVLNFWKFCYENHIFVYPYEAAVFMPSISLEDRRSCFYGQEDIHFGSHFLHGHQMRKLGCGVSSKS